MGQALEAPRDYREKMGFKKIKRNASRGPGPGMVVYTRNLGTQVEAGGLGVQSHP